MGKPPTDADVNSEVNPCLSIRELPNFPTRARDRKKIMVLLIGGRCPALEFLVERQKSSQSEYKKLIKLLSKLAENDETPNLETIKAVGTRRQLLQLDGNKNARLYCFQEDGNLVVCTSGFWIGRGNKRRNQNAEIEAAEALMERWRNSRPVPAKPLIRSAKLESKK